MSEPKFTPGPWKVKHRHCYCTAHDNEYDGLGLEVEGPPEATNRGQFARSADALLIAAAPQLYEALAAVEWEECHTDTDYNKTGELIWYVCPSCDGVRDEGGHAPDCQLAAALKAARGE